MKIRSKLMIGFGIAALTAFSAISVISYMTAMNIIRGFVFDSVREQVHSSIETARLQYNNKLKELEQKATICSSYFNNEKFGLTLTENPSNVSVYSATDIDDSSVKKVRVTHFSVQDIDLTVENDYLDELSRLISLDVSVYALTEAGLVKVSASTSMKIGYDEGIHTLLNKNHPVTKKIAINGKYVGIAKLHNGNEIVAAEPLLNSEGGVTGAVTVSMIPEDIAGIDSMIRSIVIGESGYLEVFNQSGKQLIHPTKTGQVREDQNHIKMIEQGEGRIKALMTKDSMDALEDESTEKYYVFQTYEDLGWIIAGNIYIREFYSPLQVLRMWLLIIVAVALVVMVVISVLLSNSIVKTIMTIHQKIRSMARVTEKADLTRKIDLNTGDELSYLVTEFNRLIDKLNGDIYQVTAVSDDVEQMSGKVTDIIDRKVMSHVQQIKDNIGLVETRTSESTSGIEELSQSLDSLIQNNQNIVSNMDKQSVSVDRGASATEQMVRNFEMVTETTNKTKDISNELNQMANQGGEAVTAAMESINQVSDYSKQILKMLQLITGISKQTNLLAMNASIEAAHAGEAGRGFAIVADEIRRLSEDTNKNAQDISNVVNSIVAKIGDSVSLSNQAGEVLQKIISSSSRSTDMINELSLTMEEQNQGAKDVLEATQDIVHITESVRYAMEQQINTTSDFGDALRDIRDLSITNKDEIKNHLMILSDLIHSLDEVKMTVNENLKTSEKLQEIVDRFVVSQSSAGYSALQKETKSAEKMDLKLVE